MLQKEVHGGVYQHNLINQMDLKVKTPHVRASYIVYLITVMNHKPILHYTYIISFLVITFRTFSFGLLIICVLALVLSTEWPVMQCFVVLCVETFDQCLNRAPEDFFKQSTFSDILPS